MSAHAARRAPDPRARHSPPPAVPVRAVCSCGQDLDHDALVEHLRAARARHVAGVLRAPPDDVVVTEVLLAVALADKQQHLERLEAGTEAPSCPA